jgi:2-[(L-alanin-3-ylcarbamoyl)methyl]-2-hydroxybutanedioate decarboxylase
MVGFQFHELCNNINAQDHAAYIAWCLDWSHHMATNLGVNLRVVDVGGGIGAGSEQQGGMDPIALGHCLRELSPPRGCRVVLEPGRYLVADCGYYAAEVTDVKRVAGTWFAVLSGGINHFLRPALGDYSGTVTVFPIDDWETVLPRPGVSDAPVTLVGALCSPADVLARDIAVPEVRAGDVIVFSQAGSYGWELAIHQFLGHPPAQRTTV